MIWYSKGAWKASILRIFNDDHIYSFRQGNSLFNWHCWHILCAMKEHYNRSIDEAMLVGSEAFGESSVWKRA